jgi:pre-mRNA-splicing factor ATP-dependent RNA helicase DHX16
MKRARDVRNQLEGLLEMVEIELSSNPNGLDAIKKSIASGFFPIQLGYRRMDPTEL